jgi:hypothetical protein
MDHSCDVLDRRRAACMPGWTPLAPIRQLIIEV